MNFPEFLESAFFLALLSSSVGNPEIPENFRHSLEGILGAPSAFSGEDEVDMFGSGERWPLLCLSQSRFGGSDLHRSASFRTPKPKWADPDKVQKPSVMASSRFPDAILSWELSDLAFQPGLL